MSDTEASRTRCARCEMPGIAACNGCHLVAYCGRDCQISRWSEHKKDCKSPLAKDSWQPQWVIERRAPVFLSVPSGPFAPFGGPKSFWGTLPAFDIVQLTANEGQSYNQDLNLLFAATEDLRNVITSINALPREFTAKVSVVLTEVELDAVARNLIILLIALAVPDEQKEQAIECMIHLWFSAFVRQQDMDILEKFVLPLIQDVVSKTAGRAADKMLGKSWTFEKGSCRAVLTKSHWDLLPSYLRVSSGLTTAKAQTSRKAITLAPHRQDYRDRRLSVQLPAHRVPQEKFREDGILLSFGHSRKGHSVPNPTFFRGKGWPMTDCADPTQAWPLPAVLNTVSGLVANDIYGKLFFFLKERLAALHARLNKQSFEFTLYNLDTTALRGHLPLNKFARIEVSTSSEESVVGAKGIVACMSPLLQAPKDNPCATLITLFMDAVPRTGSDMRDYQEAATAIQRSQLILGDLLSLRNAHDPKYLNALCATRCFSDFDHYFETYKQRMGFDGIEEANKVRMKERHTIINKWPFRLELSAGQAEVRKELDILMVSELGGHERYVEWLRTT